MINIHYQSNSNHTFPEVQEKIISQYFSYEEVVNFFLEFLINIANAMRTEEIYASSDLIITVKKYIQLHYKEDINLNFLSEIFYVNSSYLSSLFKQKAGIKYIDYLNELRINKAKELLKTTNKSSSQIARHVGYDNEKYFYRVFKKYTAFSPEKYRKEMLD